MAVYPELGLQREDGIVVSLLDAEERPLPFLNHGLFEDDDLQAMFAPAKAYPAQDITIPIHLPPGCAGFFPEDSTRFTVGTDDQQTFECRFLKHSPQEGLHFTQGNAPIQQYFRRRLQIDKGGFVSRDDLTRYGTASFLMFRLDEFVYFVDFSTTADSNSRQITLLEKAAA